MERLAEQIAVAEGVSVTEVLREGLLLLAGSRGLTPRKAPLRERLAKLAQEVDATPPHAPRPTPAVTTKFLATTSSVHGDRHLGQLNFGDCAVYALARVLGEPLLFVGNDFAQTDIERC